MSPASLFPIPAEHLIEPPDVPELSLQELLLMRLLLHPPLPGEHLWEQLLRDPQHVLRDGESTLLTRAVTQRTLLHSPQSYYLPGGFALRTRPRREALHIALV